jgi:hypothetical protein
MLDTEDKKDLTIILHNIEVDFQALDNNIKLLKRLLERTGHVTK